MIFIFGSQEQLDGTCRFFNGDRKHDVFEGMIQKALASSRAIDVLGVHGTFAQRLGEQHPAAQFWSKVDKCALSTWETVDPYIAFIEYGMLEPHLLAADAVPWVWDENAYTILNGSRLYGLQD